MRFIMHPSRQNCAFSTAVAKGLGSTKRRSTLCGNPNPTRLPVPISIGIRFAHPEHLLLRVGVFGMLQSKCTTCLALYSLPVRASVLNRTARALAKPVFGNNVICLGF